MNSFYELLQKIRKRPAMYLGQASISHLRSYLSGYIFARRELNLPQTEEEKQFFGEFSPWLKQKFNIHSDQPWDKIILFYSADEGKALDRFFELLDEFLKSTKQNETTTPQNQQINDSLFAEI